MCHLGKEEEGPSHVTCLHVPNTVEVRCEPQKLLIYQAQSKRAELEILFLSLVAEEHSLRGFSAAGCMLILGFQDSRAEIDENRSKLILISPTVPMSIFQAHLLHVRTSWPQAHSITCKAQKGRRLSHL